MTEEIKSLEAELAFERATVAEKRLEIHQLRTNLHLERQKVEALRESIELLRVRLTAAVAGAPWTFGDLLKIMDETLRTGRDETQPAVTLQAEIKRLQAQLQAADARLADLECEGPEGEGPVDEGPCSDLSNLHPKAFCVPCQAWYRQEKRKKA